MDLNPKGRGQGNKALGVAVALASARSHGMCEGCGAFTGGKLDPHHRQARGMGGVYRAAETVANNVRNLLMLCRPCHDKTEADSTWRECLGLGWRIPKWVEDPWEVPAYIHTVNGTGWWILTGDGGYQWSPRDKSLSYQLMPIERNDVE